MSSLPYVNKRVFCGGKVVWEIFPQEVPQTVTATELYLLCCREEKRRWGLLLEEVSNAITAQQSHYATYGICCQYRGGVSRGIKDG